MSNGTSWSISADSLRSSPRLGRITLGIDWARSAPGRFVVFSDGTDPDRFVQFATEPDTDLGQTTALVVAVAAPVPQLAMAGTCGGQLPEVPVAVSNDPTGLLPAGSEHAEALIMEVGSRDWPGSTGGSLAHNAIVVARLASHGLRIRPAQGHGCRNFCRLAVPDPTLALAAMTEEIMIGILGAPTGFHLLIKRGRLGGSRGWAGRSHAP